MSPEGHVLAAQCASKHWQREGGLGAAFALDSPWRPQSQSQRGKMRCAQQDGRQMRAWGRLRRGGGVAFVHKKGIRLGFINAKHISTLFSCRIKMSASAGAGGAGGEAQAGQEPEELTVFVHNLLAQMVRACLLKSPSQARRAGVGPVCATCFTSVLHSFCHPLCALG